MHSDAEEYLSRGMVSHHAGRTIEALKHYVAALVLRPAAAPILNQLARLWLSAGGAQQAALLLARAAASIPEASEFHANRGVALRASGQIKAAIAAYRTALCLSPGEIDTWVNLSVALEQVGDLASGIRAGANAIAAAPGRAELYFNQANFRRRLGEWDASEAALGAAIERRRDFVEAYFNLGNLLLERHRQSEARRLLRAAVTLAPQHSRGWSNLALLDFAEGRQNHALALCDRAIEADGGSEAKSSPDIANMLANRFMIRLQEAPTAEWPRVVRSEPWAGQPHESVFIAHVSSAIGHWVGGDPAAMARDLGAADREAQMVTDWTRGNLDNIRQYRNLLRLLGSEPNQADGAAPSAYIVGDSHCLSYVGSSVVIEGRPYALAAELIMGCKAWHLANGEGNRYKSRFEWLARQFRAGSPVVCSFGEIDCRPGEGLLPFIKRSGGAIEQVAAEQAGAYVEYIRRILSATGHRAVVAGIPAPHLRSPLYQRQGAEEADLRMLAEIIAAYNMSLRTACAAAGIDFIDLYSITVGHDGVSHGRRHIDAIHLRPAGLIAGC